MPIEIRQPTFVPEDKVPVRITRRSEEWAAFLKTIPKGQALVTTRQELGVSASSLKVTMDRLMEKGLIPPTYYLRQHKTREGKVEMYIVNSLHKAVRRKKRTSKEDVAES